ncbi:ribosome small subunit-dependent GTPase A [Phosphitispora sp. TUW77]|uniref:ribosome small subunit-dependent GTPase A n=1 Tax=Phosphitispora sp. TUW77 TaxID=3152361 RepID=UPI003AB88850
MLQGTVIRAYSGFYYVEIDKEVWECRLRGKFRLLKQNVLPGDRVKVQDGGGKTGVIEEILPRVTVLERPQVANVDQVLIVFACASPDPQTDLTDRMLVHAEAAGLLPIICFNKTDLVGPKIINSLKSIYDNIGYKVLFTSTITGEGIGELRNCLKGRLTVFAGPSGAGKSSLLNAVYPGFELKTGQVSKKIGRGRHTTRYAELLELEPDSLVVDTPGFSNLYMPEMDNKNLGEMFPEFMLYAEKCRFNGCLHKAEPDCAVKEALHQGKISPERYKHYVVFLEELESREKKY